MLVITACAVAPVAKAPPPQQHTSQAATQQQNTDNDVIAPLQEPRSDPAADLQYHVLAAELAANRGVLKTAAAEYFAAAQLSNAPDLSDRATRLALATGDDQMALQAARRWMQVAPKAVAPREIILRQNLHSGDTQGALDQCMAIIQSHPEGAGAGMREIALVMSSDPAYADQAIAVMRQVVEKFPLRAHAHYALGLLAVRLNRLDIARDEAGEAIRIDPKWQDSYLLKAGALVRLGKIDKAKQIIEQIVARKPQDTQIRLAYARLLLEADQAQPAIVEYQQVLQLDDSNSEALFAMGLLSLNARDSDQAYKYFHSLYDTGERRDDAAWYLGQIEEQRGHFREAYEWYGQVAEGGQAFPAAIRRAFVLTKLEGLDAARHYLTELRNNNPELGAKLSEAEGELLFDANKMTDALKVYNDAVLLAPGNTDLLYDRAMVEVELSQTENAERDLRQILDADPNSARSLNALGYMLSNQSQRYQEALSYIDRALKLTPQDAAVLDSMGWVQYRLGNLDAALNYLQDAFKRQHDPEIAAHLGEVLWRLGMQDKAKAVWQDALVQFPDHHLLRETVTRLSK